MSRKIGRFPTTEVPLNNFAPVFAGFRRPEPDCLEPSGLKGSREDREGDNSTSDFVFDFLFAEPGVFAAPGDMNCDCVGHEGKTWLSTAVAGKL